MLIVMKFGGTSVADAGAFRRVGEIVKSRLSSRPIVVVSAIAKMTDELVNLANSAVAGDLARVQSLTEWMVQRARKIQTDLGREGSDSINRRITEMLESLGQSTAALALRGLHDRELVDRCLSEGELLSSTILAEYLRSLRLEAAWLDARRFLVTDSRFGKARPMFSESRDKAADLLLPVHATAQVVVTQGFIGGDLAGRTTTLGRGGSDYSATFIGAVAGASGVEIWTDVDGILTADPSLVKEAKRIREMTFDEAAELAYFGAKVLHPATIWPAVEHGIPVFVLNSMRAKEAGTKIIPTKASRHEPMIKSIAYKEGISVLNIKSTRMLMAYGFLNSIFEIFNRFETAVDLVATSEVSVSVTVDNLDHIEEVLQALGEFADVEIRSGKAIVCCVGENICRQPGMPAKILGELEGIEISLISQGASRINVSFVIDESELPTVINRLHGRFFSGALDVDVFAG